jgi:hypothetical protein
MNKGRTVIFTLAAVTMVTFWPWLGNPFAYTHFRDSLRTSPPIAFFLGEPCETRWNGIRYFDATSNCYRFDPPREYRGIWIYQYEGSEFIENATEVPKQRPDHSRTSWLNQDKKIFDPDIADPALEYDPKLGCGRIQAFKVRFVGQRNPHRGGHMGLWPSEIWMRRLISVERLPEPNCSTY